MRVYFNAMRIGDDQHAAWVLLTEVNGNMSTRGRVLFVDHAADPYDALSRVIGTAIARVVDTGGTAGTLGDTPDE